MSTLAIRLSTRCPHCSQVLPLNRFDQQFACRACLGHLDVPADLWSRLLEETIDEEDRHVGEARSETRQIKGRTFELWTDVVDTAPGAKRDAGAKIAGVRTFVGEEAAVVASTDPIRVSCGQCGGSPSTIPDRRDFKCEFCQASSLIADRVWERLHPEAAIKTWYLVIPTDDDVKSSGEPTFAMGDDLIPVDNGAIATVVFANKSALVRIDSKLAIRWRVDLAEHDTLRLIRVGGEVWLADASKHVATRYSIDDGRLLGTIGEIEPAGAKLASLDLRGLGDWAMLGDGTMMTLLCNRLVRFKPDGKPVDTWPKKGGFLLGWLFNAAPVRLYQGPPVDDDGDELEPERKHAALSYDELGNTRPYCTMLVNRRLAADASSLWIDTGAKIYRYGLDGKRLGAFDVPKGSPTSTVRPVVDDKGGLYSVAFDADHDSHSIVYTDGQTSRTFATSIGFPKALMWTGAGVWIFGTQDGDVRHVDISGKVDHSSRGAIQADRWNSDQDDQEVA